MQAISSKDKQNLEAVNSSKFYCIKGNTSVDVCLNTSCPARSHIFLCIDRTCDCNKSHIKCIKGNLSTLICIVEEKVLNIQPLKLFISSAIQKSIDELSLLEESLITYLDEEFKFCQFNEDDRHLYNLLKGQSSVEEFTSIQAFDIWYSEVEKIQSQKKSCGLKQKLNELNQNIATGIQPFKKLYAPKIPLMTYKQLLPEQIVLANDIKKFSAIIKQDVQISFLFSMFQKNIKNIKCMFQASQNQFSIRKYFGTCGDIKNTLIVCKTNKDKIIGAFSPLIHDHENKDNFVPDPRGESFIFSLNDCAKFTLDKRDKAICRQKSRDFINFGGGQFIICDKANESKKCVSLVNKSVYFCKKYTKNDMKAYLKFNGNQTAEFTTKEWEVWAVQFINP